MTFDKKILELSSAIYQTLVMCHNTKCSPTRQIDKIIVRICEFTRLQVVLYELKVKKLHSLLKIY